MRLPAAAFALAIVPAWLSACGPQRVLSAELCGNGIDDDADSLMDCEDPQCGESELCQAQGYELPEGPEWLGLGDEVRADLGVITEPCSTPDGDDQLAAEEHLGGGVESSGCRLLSDDCGYGMRCIVLSVEGVAVDTGCVRQGCAPKGSACELRGLADDCGSGTICLEAPDICGDRPCCVPYCATDDVGCSSCLALSQVYESELEQLETVGICLD